MDYEKIKNNQKKKVIYTDAKIKLSREYLFTIVKILGMSHYRTC